MGDGSWKSYRYKEDQTQSVSQLIFVTKFLNHVTAHDLWKVCNDYGVVMDAFIPYKKSKACKRFTFVRFIKVDNIDRLVANLCTIWIGRFYLHANVGCFHRERKHSAPSHPSNANERNSPSSFVSIFKSGKTNYVMSDQGLPSLILDDSCILDRDFSLSLMGVGSWFSALKTYCNSFVSDERIVWISLEGLPLKVYAKETEAWDPFICNDLMKVSHLMMKNAEDDGSQSGDKVIADNDVERVSESSCIHNNDLLYDNNHNNIILNKDKVLSEDPFNLYDILNKRKDSGDDLKYPPGFTPSVINVEEVNEKVKGATSNEVNEHVNYTSNKLEESVPKEKLSLNNSVCSKRVHTGGLILQLMDELVKVGQTMGYNMEGYMRNIEVIIKENATSSLGNLWGILCVWEPTLFVKDNVTSSDNFLAVMDIWVHSSSKLLIVSVYAPRDLTEKRALWDYILHLIDQWDRDCVIMVDFNGVRTEHERYGSVFNVQGLLASFPFLSAICLDRNLSDHHRILMQELSIDYGPTPFRFFHSWFKLDGFDKMVEDTWKSLATVDSNGGSNEEILSDRSLLLKELNGINSIDSLEAAQKSKVGVAIEGDKNTKFFHGILNTKRSQLAICGTLVDGEWIVDSLAVKSMFLKYFSTQCSSLVFPRICFAGQFTNRLSLEQQAYLKRNVYNEDIKSVVWDCGTNKSPGPDGFTFEFFRRYWKLLEHYIVAAIKEFFASAFVSNCQILDGPFILNELLSWCKHKKFEAMVFKVDFEKAFNSIQWDYLQDILKVFGFGDKWCGWINGCLNSVMGSVLVNGSPNQNSNFTGNANLFSGISIDSSLTLSHIFFADDAIFVGIGTHPEEVDAAATTMGCLIFTTPFVHLGVKVGGAMSRIKSWDDVVAKVSSRLSKWKLKTLSIGGRLTLIKSVLTSIPLYHMSIFKVPSGVLKLLSRLEETFLMEWTGRKKMAWISWNKEDPWLDHLELKHKFPRLYAFDNYKQITVVEINHASMVDIFRRPPRGGAEEEQLGEFSVKSVRQLIDDSILSKKKFATRWVKVMPIKINVFAWRVYLDKLPTLLNLSLKGIDISTILCPLWHASVESGSHIFFSCPMARQLWRNLMHC
nr:hypothetical protein [Tanacetum cinerariifolium]GEV70048.1 hypothetical protein [Tanacetum cinerariifolium]